jgi:hypothetical protein
MEKQQQDDTPYTEGPITEMPTQDIALAAFLSTKHRMLSIDGERGSKLTFWFPIEAEADVEPFYTGIAQASARDVIRAFRDLRLAIIDMTRRPPLPIRAIRPRSAR